MSGLGLRLAAGTSRTARTVSLCARPCQMQSRALHKRKELSYPIEEGLGTFLSPDALKMIAVDYQQGLLDRLNDQVRGTSLEHKSIVHTIIDAARVPEKVLEFNYACEALNNSFFLDNLKPSGNPTSPQSNIMRRIQFEYGSLASFQSNFSAAVLGMFSSGWIWLVSDQLGKLGIVPTFGPGTLLIRASEHTKTFTEWQRLAGDPVLSYMEPDPRVPPPPGSGDAASFLDTPPLPPSHGSSPASSFSSPLTGSTSTAPPLDAHTPTRSYSRPAAPPGTHPNDRSVQDEKRIGDVLHPLLCVSVHEHAWVGAGYGVWGKEEYMKRFWSVVDWERVGELYNKVKPPTPGPIL